MKRKFLAWLLTLAMVFNMAMPYTALADDFVDTDSNYSAGEFGATNNDDDATEDVEGEPTVGEPSTDDEPAVGKPSDEEPAVDPVDGNENNTESDGKEAGEEPVDEPVAEPNVGAFATPQGGVAAVADTGEPVTSGSLGATTTWAYDAETQTLTISGTGATGNSKPWETNYKKEIEKLVVKEGVTDLGCKFANCSNLKSVSLPDSLTNIALKAFATCAKLTDVTFGANCKTKIGVRAFQKCPQLTTVTFGANCKAETTSLTFEGCTALEEIVMPAGMTIGASGEDFKGCTGLKKATIPMGAPNMFTGCTSLTEVVYQDGATSFGKQTFQGCTTLTKVTVPRTLTDWGNNPFPAEIMAKLTFDGPGKDNFQTVDGIVYNKDKTKLLVAITLPTGSFEVPASVTAIGDSAFAGATGLTAVTFAEGSKLESIGINAFNGCTKLASITFPDTLKTIGSDAFSGCSVLSGVTLPSKLESIGSNAFKNCAKITAVTLPEGLTSLGSNALAGTAIEELTLPKSLTTVNPIASDSSAAPCEKLTKLVILGEVIEIPENFLAGCKNIKSAVFPKTVTEFSSMGAWPFNYNNDAKFIYWGGTKEQFEATNLGATTNESFKNYCDNYNCSVIYNYVMPTTEDGKLEVVSYPSDIMAEDMASKTISLQLKYPSGTAKQDGDKIWVDWYYTQKTPNGLDATKALSNSNYAFDDTTMTATITLSEQAAAGATGTWNYIMVAFKTTADGKTTMLVSNPVAALQLGSGFTLNGKGTATEPFEITNYDDFKLVAGLVNNGSDFANTVFKLTADMTVPKDNAVQMGKDSSKPFSGIFDGNGKTVTYEKDAQPMFGTVSNGTIKNLNIKGDYIASNGLAETMDGSLDNCTLLSNSVTLKCGFIGSSGSINITNCTVQSDVKVGWNVDENKPNDKGSIGSIIGSGSFTLTNCKSAADVTADANYVGGLAGSHGYSTRVAKFTNCQFTGSVVASGEYIGGIMGGGYDSYTAPNAYCVTIENCLVMADITGGRAVGGIFGGEGGVDQTWDNGIGYIRNNLFYGGLTIVSKTFPEWSNTIYTSCPAANVDGSKGGIIGFQRSLNKYNIIENNYFYDKNDENTKGIGAVEHIDTSAVATMGTGTDGIYYYNTSRDKLSDIKEFVDVEDKTVRPGDWTTYTSVSKTGLNRTDDPMGKDADKLAKAVSAEDMKTYATVALLNGGNNSLKNWIKGENCPIISDTTVAYQLEISGNYKTEYYVGDTLDMSGAKFTATWTDGTTTYPDLKDVTISGFDSSKRAVLTLTATYGAASTTFEVKVLLKGGSEGGNSGNTGSSTIKVSFTLLGDKHHDESVIHTYKKGNLETWLSKEAYTVDLNATVADLLEEVEKKHSNVVSFSNPNGNWVDAVTYNGNTMTQLDNTDNSGWQYNVNKKHTELLVNQYFLNNGDSVIFYWTDDYTQDMGSEGYDNSGNQLGGGSATTTETKYTATEVIDLIDAIGTVTKDSKSAIEKARAAYDSLTEAQQKKVTNYDKLTAAEAKYTELTGEKIEVTTNSDLPFADVKSGAWYYDAIKAMYDKGLMNGEGEKEFAPNNKLSRAMLVTILYRLAEQPEVNADALFDDVAAGQWYTKAVAWANGNNIVSGVGDGKFAPNDSITRQELAAMLYRYASAVGLNATATANLSGFTDSNSVATWAETAMQWAVGSGLIKGDENGALNPTGTATRAEVATVIVRLLEMAVK